MLDEIGPIQTFGLFFALNFVVWGAMAARRLRELGRSGDQAYEMVVVCVIGGVIGAKLWWAAEEGSELTLSGLFSGAGLTWYGGLAGGALAMLAWARWRDFELGRLVDVAAIGLPLGQAVGRIGCQISGDGDYGEPWSGPWAMGYPDGVVPTEPGVEVHPTPIYESVALALIAWALWRLRDRFRPGVLFALYLVGSGIQRFVIEIWRTNDPVAGTLTLAQLVSIGLAVVGVAMLAVLARRSGGLRGAAAAAAA